MAFNACVADIQKAAGRTLSDDELDDLLSELQKRQRRARRLGAVDDDAALEVADGYARELAVAAVIEKRNAALNLKKRLEAVDFVRSQFADNPALGVEALLAGVNRAGLGTRYSASAVQRQLSNSYKGGFKADVERAGLWKLLVSGHLDREVARVLWADGTGAVPAVGPEAKQLATIISKWQEVARQDANRAGAWIGKLPGYVVRQSHDLPRVRAAGYDAWRQFILQKLDVERTVGDADLEDFLLGVYDGLASGVHIKVSDSPSGFKGPRNIAKGLSQERVLHFKDADSWLDYHQKFGRGMLAEAVFTGLERTANSTGLMRVLGPNAEANIGSVIDELTRGLKGDPDAKAKLDRARHGRLKALLAEADGSARIPANQMAAQISAGVRAVETLSKLGGALLSSFSDIPVYGSEMRYQGRTMLGGMGEAIGSLVKGRGNVERRAILGQLGVFFDSINGAIGARFAGQDDLPGAMSRMQRLYFSANILSFWTDTIRGAAALSMSHRLAMLSGTAWDGLDGDLRRVLGLFGIDDGKWNIARQAAAKQADGREYMIPEAVRDLPDDVFANYLTAKGFKSTKAKVRDLREEIESQFRSYFSDRAEYAVIEPDARTMAFMRRGHKPGTIEGDTLRFIGQFKSFTVAMMQKPLGREVYGRGSNTLGKALRNGNGEMLGLANLILWTTVFGYGSMAAKDLAKGRTPRDPTDPKTWGAAMVQGGGLGIYGDFLFGEANRFGGGLIGTLAGPAAGSAGDLFDIWTRVRDGDDAAAQSFRFALNHTPFVNLFYTRTALDHLLLFQVQEALNPGSVERMQRRVERDNRQTFLIPPSSAVR